MSLDLPQRILHVMHLDDNDADTVGRALKWGSAESFLNEAGEQCVRVEGTLEVEDYGRRRTVKVRRTLDVATGTVVTEHQSGRQDAVIQVGTADATPSAPPPS